MFLQFAQLVPSGLCGRSWHRERERETLLLQERWRQTDRDLYCCKRERERSLLLQGMLSTLRPSYLPSFRLPPSAVMGLSPSSPSSACLSYHFGLGQEREKVTGLILTVLLYGVWRADMLPVTEGGGGGGGGGSHPCCL